MMASNKVQKGPTNASNKDRVGDLTRDGRVTSTNPIQSPQSKTVTTDERAVVKAEKAFRKAQKDKNDRLEKHEAVETSQYPSNSFVALSLPPDRLRALNYPAAERIWGVDYKPLGLSKDWTKRDQNPTNQIRYQPVQPERTVPGGQRVLHAPNSPVHESENLIINNDSHSPGSQITISTSQKNQALVGKLAF